MSMWQHLFVSFDSLIKDIKTIFNNHPHTPMITVLFMLDINNELVLPYKDLFSVDLGRLW